MGESMRFDGWIWRHVVDCMAAMSVLEQAYSLQAISVIVASPNKSPVDACT